MKGKYIHTKTGNTYYVTGTGKLKWGDQWYLATFYQNEEGELFSRTTAAFNKRFEKYGQRSKLA